VRGEKALSVAGGREPSHGPLPLPRRVMGVLRPVVHRAVLPVFHAEQNRPLSGLVALQLSGDDDPGDIPAPVEELAEECLGRVLVPPTLHQNIEDVPVLIHGPSEIVALAMNREQDLIEVPHVARPRAPAPELIGIGLAEFPTPFMERLLGDDDAAREQEFFDIPVAEAEAEVQPHTVAEDLRRKTTTFI
jgi:hypothetical protein